MCRSQSLTRCEAFCVRGGWHAPCLVARGQRTLSRQGHRRERERECGITRASWPISSHDDVGAGHELHSVSTWTICSRKTGRIRLPVARVLLTSAVPPHTVSDPFSYDTTRRDCSACKAHCQHDCSFPSRRFVWRRIRGK
jgi:hypothetical protein